MRLGLSTYEIQLELCHSSNVLDLREIDFEEESWTHLAQGHVSSETSVPGVLLSESWLLINGHK